MSRATQSSSSRDGAGRARRRVHDAARRGRRAKPDEGGTGDDATVTETGADGARDSRAGDTGTRDGGIEGAVVGNACAPPSSRCESLQPEVCGADGLWHEAGAPCPFVCEDAGCTGMCAPATKQCSGLTPQSCDSQGHWQGTRA